MQCFCRPHSNKPPTRKPPGSARLDMRKRRRGTSDQTMFGPERADRYIHLSRYSVFRQAFWWLSKVIQCTYMYVHKTNSYGVVATPRRPRASPEPSRRPFRGLYVGRAGFVRSPHRTAIFTTLAAGLVRTCEGVKKVQVPQDFFM